MALQDVSMATLISVLENKQTNKKGTFTRKKNGATGLKVEV